MTLWWIGNVALFAVFLVAAYLLHGVFMAAKTTAESVQAIARTAAAGSRDLDAATLLVRTRDQVEQTIAVAADYGGSLDVILDDAEER
jgi:hypothetical protein